MKKLSVLLFLMLLASCRETKKGNSETEYSEKEVLKNDSLSKEYKDMGMSYALSTKAVLGKNLTGTIQKNGTLAALKFCNVRAYSLTDSMATVHQATIKRVSDKPRNRVNMANEEELGYIDAYKKTISEGKDITPIVVQKNDKVNFYYPIITNAMCLQCHGKPDKEVKPEILAALKELYPKDMAQGYDVDQVRGVWSISFKKE